MQFHGRLRLAALVAAAALVGAAIAWIIVGFQRQSRELQARLNNVDAESGQIASQFKDELRDVTNARLQDEIGRDPAGHRQFLAASRHLSDWLEAQGAAVRTPEERNVLRELKAAYRVYLHLSEPLPIATSGPASADSLAAFTRVRSESQHLFDLGQDLAAAHYHSRNQLLTEAGEQLQGLRATVLGLLAVLFLFGIILAWVAYRDLVAPLQVKLVQSQELAERREKLASLGMLAAGVAHEIRNPLTALKAALFIQQKRFKPDSPEHADSEVVQREIIRLERIVNDFLRFARPSDPQLVVVEADALLEETRQIFAAQLEKSAVRLAIGGRSGLRVKVDPEQMKQVLINLVQNAIDSIPGAGTVTLGSRRDWRALAGADREVVVLEIADTGRGIPSDVGKRLFDPFFTTKEHGTGLGLSIAARIVEKHGGGLQYQTQVNRGTTFGIVLPLVPS